MSLAEMWRKKMEPMKTRERTRTMKGSLDEKIIREFTHSNSATTHTRNPGESSVYSFSIVFEDPPAPAARLELGLTAWFPVARRLFQK